MYPLTRAEKKYVEAVGAITLLCSGMYFVRLWATGTARFTFILENLVLAWLALVFAWMLVKGLKRRRWLSWQNVTLSFLWVVFLPNAWYVLTDLIHVAPTGEISELYDAVMIGSLIIAGFSLGFTSLYLVHREFIKRWSTANAHLVIGLILLLSSFAIYLGRNLRWSTWDVVANPTGIIIDVSDRVIDPFGHPRALNITMLFFVFLGVLYWAIWQMLNALRLSKK